MNFKVEWHRDWQPFIRFSVFDFKAGLLIKIFSPKRKPNRTLKISCIMHDMFAWNCKTDYDGIVYFLSPIRDKFEPTAFNLLN